MDTALARLTEKISPPPHPRLSNVDWPRLESSVGLVYPDSFKEFVNLYGGCVWFDNVAPLFCEAKSDADIKRLLKSINRNLSFLKSNLYNEDFTPLTLPLYPEKGGLFPFLVDYSSNLFCWRTEQEDSSKWPVMFWNRGPIIDLGVTTIAEMIADWLDRKPVMTKVWGDVNAYDPELIRLTET